MPLKIAIVMTSLLNSNFKYTRVNTWGSGGKN
jgi:hypothetical protein